MTSTTLAARSATPNTRLGHLAVCRQDRLKADLVQMYGANVSFLICATVLARTLMRLTVPSRTPRTWFRIPEGPIGRSSTRWQPPSPFLFRSTSARRRARLHPSQSAGRPQKNARPSPCKRLRPATCARRSATTRSSRGRVSSELCNMCRGL